MFLHFLGNFVIKTTTKKFFVKTDKYFSPSKSLSQKRTEKSEINKISGERRHKYTQKQQNSTEID